VSRRIINIETIDTDKIKGVRVYLDSDLAIDGQTEVGNLVWIFDVNTMQTDLSIYNLTEVINKVLVEFRTKYIPIIDAMNVIYGKDLTINMVETMEMHISTLIIDCRPT
jgi:hypothetical protein